MKTIIGNWKMNVGVRESVALARGVLYALRGKRVIPEIVVCPSSISLAEVRKVITRSSIALGAQTMSAEESGAFTGEISARMLEEVSVSHVIIGHSERRQLFGETDEMVQKKVALALKHNLIPVLCVGETSEQREEGNAHEVVINQLTSALKDASLSKKSKLFIAYEPIWAIGTGAAAEPKDAVEMHEVIRQVLSERFSSADEKQMKILYGGSINKENVYTFLREQEVDGVLVGGASTHLSQMRDIIDAAIDAVEGTLASE